LLRAQRDGSVVRRQFFWNTSVVPAFVIVNASVIPSGGMVWSVSDFYLRLQFFVDDPAHLLQATP
jgi:hypothetical protein